jgi:hypothetical protein
MADGRNQPPVTLIRKRLPEVRIGHGRQPSEKPMLTVIQCAKKRSLVRVDSGVGESALPRMTADLPRWESRFTLPPDEHDCRRNADRNRCTDTRCGCPHPNAIKGRSELHCYAKDNATSEGRQSPNRRASHALVHLAPRWDNDSR